MNDLNYEDIVKINSTLTSVDNMTELRLIPKTILDVISKLCNKSDSTSLIPNMKNGELCLCTDRFITYTNNKDLFESVKHLSSDKHTYNFSNFLDERISYRFESILCYSTFGYIENRGWEGTLYLNKCLDLLAKNGRLIIILPHNYLSAPAFYNGRKRILDDFSLRAVIPIKEKNFRHNQLFILVIDNSEKAEKIFLPTKFNSYDELLSDFENKQGNYWINTTEIDDRIDPQNYDPEYKDTRDLIKNKNTIHLEQIADIVRGFPFSENERFDNGDYAIISSINNTNGEITLSSNRQLFCTKEVLNRNERFSPSYFIKKNDILISLIKPYSWVIANKDYDNYIPNHNILITRGTDKYRDWLVQFFTSNTGKKHLESQLEYFAYRAKGNPISRNDICSLAIPNEKTMESIENINQEIDVKEKIYNSFKSLGWNVSKDFNYKEHIFDLALFNGNNLSGVINIKNFTSVELYKNNDVRQQFNKYKKVLKDVKLFLFADNLLLEYEETKISILSDFPTPQNIESEDKQTIDFQNSLSNSFEELRKALDEKNLTYLYYLERILKQTTETNSTVKEIAEQIKILSNQITLFQDFLKKQLNMSSSEEETEHLLHSFSEICTKKITEKFSKQAGNKEYNIELQKLVISLGQNTWNKLEEGTKSFLVSSKLIYNSLIALSDTVDYSGVCLLVTKALEVELSKKFCKEYLDFLKTKFPTARADHYAEYPKQMLNKYNKPIRETDFTLGSAPFILCHYPDEDKRDNVFYHDRNIIVEYAKGNLFPSKNEDEIICILDEYGEKIDEVTKKYRNPAAHTNQLKKIDAQQCFELVLDVEKLLKKIIDSFEI